MSEREGDGKERTSKERKREKKKEEHNLAERDQFLSVKVEGKD
jgi:hypothetical protein